jgi:ABC-type nitrate/sulfonate/bicarbonate transport system substrate-binding protein
VDAISTWEPYGTLILEKLPGSVLVIRGGGNLGYVIMASTTEDMIKNQPEVVERFVLGVAEATQYARQHPDEAAEISTRWIPGLDLDVAKKAIRYMPFDARISKHTIQAFDDSVNVLLEQKKLKRPVDASDAVNTTFIEKVMREHPELFGDLKPIP